MNINRISSGGMDNVRRRPATQEPGTAESVTPPAADPKPSKTLSPAPTHDIDPETTRGAREAREFGKRLREEEAEKAAAALIAQYRHDITCLLVAMGAAVGCDPDRQAVIQELVDADKEIRKERERRKRRKKKK